ncbi:hypothetical protein [Streptomyces radicis]|uniref:Histone protein n=1 Tax=Streptomyces radicis TaxID=1750517 RepID=A0A3A9W8E1_9ACTN|nr:hypothetical protein [Streptomyces radicis]RKN09368.1 hypothetical protein D7319_12985 [Streptomyces radicis]RKN23034.1 hypothetical protein D7318_13540 [Streptomyces radicis]
MEQHTKAALAAGIASGYLLGRRRKAKLAFAVATYVVGRRFRLRPRDLAGEGVRRLKDNEHVAQLTGQIRGELLHAGRSAATTAANHHLTGLAETLRSRTEALAAHTPGAHDGDAPEREGDSRARDGSCPPASASELADEAEEETAEPKRPKSRGHGSRTGKKAARGKADRIMGGR